MIEEGAGRVVVGRGRTADVVVLSETEVAKIFNNDATGTAAEGEFRWSDLASRAGVATARPIRRDIIDGRSAIVFERVDGSTLLEVVSAKPWRIRQVARTLAALGAQVGSADAAGLRTVRGIVGDRLEAAPLTNAQRRTLSERLGTLPDGASLCHLDLHPDNVIMSSNGPVIIDWANAGCGDHAADIAQSVLLLTCASPPSDQPISRVTQLGRRQFARMYLRAATTADVALQQRVLRWLPALAGARLAERNPGEAAALQAVIASAATGAAAATATGT